MKKMEGHFCRENTVVSEDGRTVFCVVRVSRREYEFARDWAEYHSGADPAGTAEEQIEGYISTALSRHIQDMDWKASAEIGALYPKPAPKDVPKMPTEFDDDLPF